MTQVFTQVSTKEEKYLTYKEKLERLKVANAQGFYFEGIFILYAMMEDRLSAFLYYAGLTKNSRNKFSTSKMIKPYLDEIRISLDKKEIEIRKISSKIMVICAILQWTDNFTPDAHSTDYRNVLIRQFGRTAGNKEIASVLERVQVWCGSRNELVHALLNKRLEDQEELLRELVDEGIVLSRKLDNFVRSFKVRNNIRKQFNVQ